MSSRVVWSLCAAFVAACSIAPVPPRTPAVAVAEASFAPAAPRQDVLAQLLAGNQRFTSGHATGAGRDAERRTEIAKGQHPYAIVVTCSDSRVCPELLFDTGLGELFVVRTAGHVIDDHALGSIEYAAEHLHAHTILVLGHERCGAVQAAMQGGELPGHIGSLVTAIAPGIAAAKAGNDAMACVQANVRATVQALRQNHPLLAELVQKHEIAVQGAVYDLDTGAVELLDPPAAAPR